MITLATVYFRLSFFSQSHHCCRRKFFSLNLFFLLAPTSGIAWAPRTSFWRILPFFLSFTSFASFTHFTFLSRDRFWTNSQTSYSILLFLLFWFVVFYVQLFLVFYQFGIQFIYCHLCLISLLTKLFLLFLPRFFQFFGPLILYFLLYIR